MKCILAKPLAKELGSEIIKGVGQTQIRPYDKIEEGYGLCLIDKIYFLEDDLFQSIFFFIIFIIVSIIMKIMMVLIIN